MPFTLNSSLRMVSFGAKSFQFKKSKISKHPADKQNKTPKRYIRNNFKKSIHEKIKTAGSGIY